MHPVLFEALGVAVGTHEFFVALGLAVAVLVFHAGYRGRTGALFAPAVAAGMALGRIGCLLTEAPGTPTGHDWGIVLDPASAAHTAQSPGN